MIVIKLSHKFRKAPISVQVRRTGTGNLSFEFDGVRHVLTRDGRVLQRVGGSSGPPSWDVSPVLTSPPLKSLSASPAKSFATRYPNHAVRRSP